jgi:molybdenum cofactor cytidylyltransferase
VTGGAILLAAGASRRFGSDKRRHVLADGTPLMISSLRLYAAAYTELIVVLRPEDTALAEAVLAEAPAGKARIAFCPDAHLGMGYSLACGAREAAGWSYLFVALADMAWVRPATLARLVAAMEGAGRDALVQPVHRGTPGHPVGFGSALFARLERLTGDEGARAVVRGAGAKVLRLEVDDPGVLRDLDAPA